MKYPFLLLLVVATQGAFGQTSNPAPGTGNPTRVFTPSSGRPAAAPAPAPEAQDYRIKGMNGQIITIRVERVTASGVYGTPVGQASPQNVSWSLIDLPWLKANQPELYSKYLAAQRPADPFAAAAERAGPIAVLAAQLRQPVTLPQGTRDGEQFAGQNGRSYELPRPKELSLSSGEARSTPWIMLSASSTNSAAYRFVFHFPTLTAPIASSLKTALSSLDKSDPSYQAVAKAAEAMDESQKKKDLVLAQSQRAFAALLREIERVEKNNSAK